MREDLLNYFFFSFCLMDAEYFMHAQRTVTSKQPFLAFNSVYSQLAVLSVHG